MTVQTTIASVDYAGNGITTVFSFPYYFLADSHLKVILIDSAGNPTAQSLTTHYTVSGAGDDAGGYVTMVTEPAIGETLRIIRDPVDDQQTDYVTNDPFPAETHETALDLRTMNSQRLRTMIGRCLRFNDGDPVASASLELPAKASRLGRFLYFDAVNGAPEMAVSVGSTVLTQSVIGGLLYPQSTPESNAGVTPSATHEYYKDIRRYGAPTDGTSDARGALAVADSIGTPIVIAGEIDYVIGTSITVTNPVYIAPNTRLKPSAGVTVTLNGGLLSDLNDWSEKRTGDGDLVVGVIQEVNADWWLAKSTTLAAPTNTVQRAISGTARGSTIRLRGQYVSTVIDLAFDEGNQATATNRDAGKSLVGIGGAIPFRFGTQSVELGAEIILGNGLDDDLMTFAGVRFGGQPSRCNFYIDGVGLNGNKANNAAGRCAYFASVKDIHGNLYAHSAAGVGIEWDPDVGDSSNVCNFDNIISVNHGSDGIRQGGLGDPQWGTVHTGGNGGDGLVCGSGLMVNQIHAYVNGDHGVVINGYARIGHIRVNDSDDANVLIAASSEGCEIETIYSANAALNPSSDPVDAHVAYSAAAIGSYIGKLHCNDTGTAAKRWVYFANGAARNLVVLGGEGTPSGSKVTYAAGAENDGNMVVPSVAMQSVAYAASITPDPYAGKALFVGELTGNIALGNFATELVADGFEFTTYFDADGTNRDITWNARFNHPDGATTTVTANTERLMKWVALGNVFQLASDQAL